METKSSDDGATTQTGPTPEKDDNSLLSSARSEESSERDETSSCKEACKVQANTSAENGGQKTKKLWAKAAKGVHRRPVSICVASCKYAVVRDAAKSLGWKVNIISMDAFVIDFMLTYIPSMSMFSVPCVLSRRWSRTRTNRLTFGGKTGAV